MINYDLPYGYCKFDSLVGEVIEMGSYGCKVLLPNEDGSEHYPLSAFVRCDGRSIGQKILVSLRYFSERYGNFVAALDSYIDAEEQEAEETHAVASLAPSAWPLAA